MTVSEKCNYVKKQFYEENKHS